MNNSCLGVTMTKYTCEELEGWLLSSFLSLGAGVPLLAAAVRCQGLRFARTGPVQHCLPSGMTLSLSRSRRLGKS